MIVLTHVIRRQSVECKHNSSHEAKPMKPKLKCISQPPCLNNSLGKDAGPTIYDRYITNGPETPFHSPRCQSMTANKHMCLEFPSIRFIYDHSMTATLMLCSCCIGATWVLWRCFLGAAQVWWQCLLQPIAASPFLTHFWLYSEVEYLFEYKVRPYKYE
jgi:hypothetical protein